MSIPRPTYACFSGVDIAAASFTVALASGSSTPKLEKSPFAQTSDGFTRFIHHLAATGVPPQQHLIVMEATGPYWAALAIALTQASYPVSVVNPAQIHYFAKAQLKRTKTDAADAITIAEFAQTQTIAVPLWTPPPRFYHELRQRLVQRDNLIQLRNIVTNQLHALHASPIVIESVQAQLEELQQTLTTQIEQMDQELLDCIKQHKSEGDTHDTASSDPDEQWRTTIALLRTIPGIGVLTACWLVLATLNFTTCEKAENLVHYVGLAPITRQSGTSIRGRPQIGHSGHARLRTLLYLATLSGVRYNPTLNVFWRRLREEKHKPAKVARCACARKLVHIAFGIVKSGKPYQANYAASASVAA